MLIYGKGIRDKLKEEVQRTALNTKMVIAILQVGDDKSSGAYIKGIMKFAEETGVEARIIKFPLDVIEKVVLEKIDELNKDPEITGIMIQTPLPPALNVSKLVNTIDYSKDVEGIHNYNLGKLLSREEGVKPSTPKAVVRMLKENNISLTGKKVTIVGRSTVVGNPLAVMLTSEDATVTLCHSRTVNLAAETRNADIIVAAVGKKNFITADMVKEDSIIIDVGINFDENGKMVGDVDEAAKAKASIASAVPGGVGTITVAELFDSLRILSNK